MLPEQSIEFRYDTQLLIDGYEDLDEDEVFDYIAEKVFWQSAETETRSRSTIIPMSPGWCWPTAGPWGRSTTSSWKIWTVRQEVCRGNGLSYEKSILWGQLLQDALFALTINSQAAIKKSGDHQTAM